MGKRELFIIAAFAVIGVAVWSLAAPPAADSDRPLSLDTVAEIWRNRNRAPAGHAVVTTAGTIAVADDLTDVRLANLLAVTVRGENRIDIAWTFEAEATGPDDAAARAVAERTTLRHDRVGRILAMSAQGAPDTPRSGTLTLQVPERLVVRVESARRTDIASVAGVRLENLVGDVGLRSIGGLITGSHRNGDLTIDDATDIALTMVGSSATVRRPRGAVRLDGRNGSLRVESPAGVVAVDVSGQDVTIVEPEAAVHAGGVGGAITIERPRAAVDLDARRTRVSLTLDRAVPVTVFSAEGSVAIALSTPPAVTLDIVSDRGEIDAAAMAIPVVERDGRASLIADLPGAPRVAIRGERSGIVIAPAK